MTKADDFKLLKIQTFILKVHIHCDGCKQEVKKLLQRIEGVYTVSIDAEQQKVTVSGNVDSKTLIKKLARSGKYAELWTQKPNNQSYKLNQQHQAARSLKDGTKNSKGQPNQALIQGLKAFKNQQHKFDSLSSDDEDYDDDDEIDVDELRLLGDKMNQLNLLRQANNAAAAAANAKKNGNAGGNDNNVAGKKGGGHANQNMGLKGPNGPDQKGLNAAFPNYKMGNVAHLGGGSLNAGEGRRVGDVNGLMGMGGLQGLGGNNVFGFHQAQQQQRQQQQHLGNTLPTGFPANGGGGLSGAHQAPMMGSLQAYQNHPSAMMMNSRGLDNNTLVNESRYMQPQMMYNRAPQIPPYTGYYYPYYPSPYLYHQVHHQPETGDYGAHLFSDENTSSCAVM
ncbi:heavy metal-associated isoprenylated plant protein 37 [Elaeis guineensis]|uniref:Heavy metal-associated isoprenylated plant protein 37 n=1 Tax=Elaeis guineensis var. tenera TaxID=51953 RepID=A0A6I9R8H2_ELAGV|nr:heavy metal-associated isoprenylated plant protein 37 [Elaeis guineensis]